MEWGTRVEGGTAAEGGVLVIEGTLPRGVPMNYATDGTHSLPIRPSPGQSMRTRLVAHPGPSGGNRAVVDWSVIVQNIAYLLLVLSRVLNTVVYKAAQRVWGHCFLAAEAAESARIDMCKSHNREAADRAIVARY